MDAAEEFTNEFIMRLTAKFDNNDLNTIRSSLFMMFTQYDVLKKKNEIAVYDSDDLVRVAKLFLSTKKLEGCTDRTIEKYGYSIKKFMEFTNNKPWQQITAMDIRGYIANRSINGAAKEVTQNNERLDLSSFFSWMLAEEYITKNPMLKVKKIKSKKVIKQPYTERELEVMRDYLKQRSLRDQALFEFLLSTGCRANEVELSNISDINVDELIVHGKGLKDRKVFLNAKSKFALEQYLNSRKDDNPALFVSILKPYNRLRVSGIEIAIREIGRATNIKAHPHKFRRTAATLALRRGMPLSQVQKMLGHESMDTTLIYAQETDESVKISHDKFVV